MHTHQSRRLPICCLCNSGKSHQIASPTSVKTLSSIYCQNQSLRLCHGFFHDSGECGDLRMSISTAWLIWHFELSIEPPIEWLNAPGKNHCKGHGFWTESGGGGFFCILVKKHSRSLFHWVFANFELVLRPHSVWHGQNACRMHYPSLWSTMCIHETFDKVTLAPMPDRVTWRAFCISTNFCCVSRSPEF